MKKATKARPPVKNKATTLEDVNALKRAMQQGREYSDALIQNAREAVLVLDGNLRVMVANRAFYRKFAVSPKETEDRLIYELGNGQWNISRLRQLLNGIKKENTRVDDFEVNYDFPRIGSRTMLLNARRIEPQEGQRLILLSIEDVTETRKHLEALKRQAALLELADDAIIISELGGAIQYWNRGAEKLYGWRKQEVVGHSPHELLQTEFPEPLEKLQERLVRAGHWEGELIHTCRDGNRKMVSSRWALRTEGDARVVLQINSNITQRKHWEDSLRKLSGRLLQVQDEERRRIARDLHDSTGQKLAALRINLDMIESKTHGMLNGYSFLAESMVLVEETMQEIRTVAQLLHPPLLDEAGLDSAIQWLINGFSSRAGINVDLAIPSSLNRLPSDIELTLFRVIQESLNNIHRHSGARQARIEIDQTPQAVVLTISDNGKGIPKDLLSTLTQAKRPLGVGLLGMRERLAQFGGKLELSSSRKGTIVKAEIPTNAPPS
ncbi:MAG: PAS domain-containing sensor histidine kinase [Terriglobia bacterium]